MKLIESRSIDYVPLAERHGKGWHLWPIWFAGDTHLATLATGAIGIVLGLGFGWSVLAILAGCALGTLFMASHSSQGPELGLPQMIQSRPQFGYRGALLVWCFALVTYVGYTVFNEVLFGVAVQDLTGMHLSQVALAVIFALFTLVSLIFAVAGYDMIHKAQQVLALIVVIALLVFSVGVMIIGKGMPQLGLGKWLVTPFLLQFFASAGYQLSWSIYVSDYSRYLPRDIGVKSTFFWTFTGAFMGGAWMMLVGDIAIAMFPGREIVGAVMATSDNIIPGFGPVLVVLTSLSLVTITTINFYGGSLTMLSILDSFHHIRNPGRMRLITLAILGVVCTWLSVIAGANVQELIENLLSVLIYLFTPWTAINLVDFFFVRHGHYSVREIFNPDGIYGKWNWRGITAYFVGFVAMIPCFSTPIFVGPIAKALGGADVSMLVELPVAALVYYIACRSIDMDAERAHIAVADCRAGSGHLIRAMLCVVALALSAGDACAATQTTDYCLTETLDGDLGDFIMKARLMIAGHHFVLDAWNIMLDNPQTLEIHADGTYRQNGPTPIRFIDNWENRGRGTFTATKSKLQIDIDTVTTSPGGANIGRNYGAYDLKSHRCKWGGQ